MRKKTKALSGASQDAYFRRVLKVHSDISADERGRLVSRLRQEVAQVRVRMESPIGLDPEAAVPAVTRTVGKSPRLRAAASKRPRRLLNAAGPAQPFDPFSPNIIVVLRQGGREAALAALVAIDSADNLRLLAREQRLNIGARLSSAAELRAAIVAAAERRIANRLAAAS